MGKKLGVRTSVSLSSYSKTVLDNISMLESHNVVHAVSCEFFPIGWDQKKVYAFSGRRRVVYFAFPNLASWNSYDHRCPDEPMVLAIE